METKARYFYVGLFVLFTLASFVLFLLWIVRPESQSSLKEYDIYFSGSLTGLKNGSPVTYKGVPIGNVKTIRIVPETLDQIRVHVAIDKNIPIKVDHYAQLEMQGLTGALTIQLNGGTSDAAPLGITSGDPYPVILSKPSKFEELLTSAPDLMHELHGLVQDMRHLFDEKNRQEFQSILTNVEDLSSSLSKSAKPFHSLVEEANATIKSLHQTLQTVNREADDISGAINRTLTEVNRASDKLGDAMTEVEGLVQENRKGIQYSVKTLSSSAEQVRTLIDQFDRMLGSFERNPLSFLAGETPNTYKIDTP